MTISANELQHASRQRLNVHGHIHQLLDVSQLLARAAAPTTDGVVVYAISGGTGAHMADMLADAGLRLPDLTKATQKTLHDGLIPAYLRVSNPVDCGGPPVADERGRKIVDAILADKNVDIVIVPITGAVAHFSEPLTRDVIEASKTTDKAIFVIWGAPSGTDDTYYRRLLDGGLPTFRTFSNCIAAVKAYTDYWTFAARYKSPFKNAATKPSDAAEPARALLAGLQPGEALSEARSKELLRLYGIPTSRDVLCTTASEAEKAAKKIGYPVVLKVSSPDLLHKSDAGLVRVGVDSAKDVRAAFDELSKKARKADKKARVEGVLVCEMVTGGVEMLVGVSQDQLFGPVITIGTGGIFTEVFGDVTFRVPPFATDEAQRALRELNGFKLLEGVRGAAAADVDALVDTIMRVQQLALELATDVRELDINPLVVSPSSGRSQGAVALDALVVRA